MNTLEKEIAMIKEAAAAVKATLPSADIALILGSGLGDIEGALSDMCFVDYKDIPYFPQPTVMGHSGKLIWGKIGDKAVYIFSGRFHYYEGNDPHTVIFPMRVLHEMGCKNVIMTCAVGGINLSLKAGDLMAITDHINLTGYNPLRGANTEEWGLRFPDMCKAYTPELRKLAHKKAEQLGIELKDGVYCGLAGPSFETPAEIRMLSILGGDVVGMSTVPEVIACAQMNMKVLAVACISNMAAGISKTPLTHEEVLETGRLASEKFSTLLKAVIPEI